MKPIVCVSGYFNPPHGGHALYITEAARHGDVIVILNSDDACVRKRGYLSMPWDQRATLLGCLRGVIDVVHVDDRDGTVNEALRRIKPRYFAKGGDRIPGGVPEEELCGHLGIDILWDIGGDKVESSSAIVNRLAEWIKEDGDAPTPVTEPWGK